ncbi:response regulator transcription factor [Microbacterium sp. gxy059]|uniref:response regulator transcription factor n=1 Tax=Microbacterium sp. gxy059 TaxID=2957199 RepID=UPI003D961B19
MTDAAPAHADLPRVLVVDDDPIVRQSVTMLIGSRGAGQVVADAADGAAAVDEARRHRPDVVLMDVRMPQLSGPDATAEILRILPETRIIAMTSLGTEEALTRMVEAGALGFLVKDRVFDEAQQAIAAVMRGDGFTSPRATAQLLRRYAEAAGDGARREAAERFARLTDREREVATLVAAGASNPEIAQRLFLSVATVKTHLDQVRAKLGAENRAHVAIVADRAGFGPRL